MSRVADWDSWIGRKVDNGFGELEVLDYEMRFKGRQNFAYFVVKCFCGDIYTTQAGHFKAKRNKSCGCRCKLEKWKYASVEGIQAKMAHGTRLTPINYSHTILKGKNSRCYWNFKCDCGKIVTYWIRDVSEGGGGTLGCGCGKHISPLIQSLQKNGTNLWNQLIPALE